MTSDLIAARFTRVPCSGDERRRSDSSAEDPGAPRRASSPRSGLPVPADAPRVPVSQVSDRESTLLLTCRAGSSAVSSRAGSEGLFERTADGWYERHGERDQRRGGPEGGPQSETLRQESSEQRTRRQA